MNRTEGDPSIRRTSNSQRGVSPLEFHENRFEDQELPFSSEQLAEIIKTGRRVLTSVIDPVHGMKAALGERWGNPPHFFLRDSAEVGDDIAEIYQLTHDVDLFELTHGSIFGFWEFQYEEGDLPHEVTRFDPDNPLYQRGFFERHGEWMFNRHSVDGLVKMLITTEGFLTEAERIAFLPKKIKAFNWILENMNGGHLSYRYRHETGGLTHQGWMDGWAGVQHPNQALNTVYHPEGMLPQDPITSVEVIAPTARVLYQGYHELKESHPELAAKLYEKLQFIKEDFVRRFRIVDEKGPYFAHALADNTPVEVFTVNNAEILTYPLNGEFLIDFEDAVEIGRRLMSPSMFHPEYGVRTIEKGNPSLKGDNYHVGKNDRAVYWPRVNNRVRKAHRNVAYVAKEKGEKEIEREFSENAQRVALANLRLGRRIGWGTEQGFEDERGELDVSLAQVEMAWTRSAETLAALELLSLAS